METINNKYKSFKELYNSVLRGNEIEFRHDGKHYYILPHYDNNKVVGASFGEAYETTNVICLSEDELYNTRIKDTILGEAVFQIELVWENF